MNPRLTRLAALVAILGLGATGCSGLAEFDASFGADDGGTSGYPPGDGDGDGDTGNGDGDGDGDGAPPVCELDMPSEIVIDAANPAGNALPVRLISAAASNGKLTKAIEGLELDPQALLNYYRFDYPLPDADLGLAVQLYHPPLAPAGRWTIQAAVVAPPSTPADRPAMHLTLVLDPTVTGTGRDHLVAAATALAAALRSGDVVTVYAPGITDPKRLFEHQVNGPSDTAVLDAVLGTPTTTYGELDDGLALALELEAVSSTAGFERQIVTISDRDVVDAASLLEAMGNTPDVRLTAVELGAEDAVPAALEELATKSHGNSLFVSDGAEAWAMMNGRFDELFVPAAREVSVALELPPGFDLVPSDLGDIEPPKGPGIAGADTSGTLPSNPLAPGSTAVLGAGDTLVLQREIETCATDTVDADTTIHAHLSWVDPTSGEVRTLDVDAPLLEYAAKNDEMQLQLHKARAMRLAMRGIDQWRDAPAEDRPALLGSITAQVEAVASALPDDEDLTQVLGLLDALSTM